MPRGSQDAQPGFIPALRFHRLTPLSDYVAAGAGRDRAIKRRVLARAGIADGDDVLDVGCGTGTLAVAAARAASRVNVTGLDAEPSILARGRQRAADAALEIRLDAWRSYDHPYSEASFSVDHRTL